jgi:Neurotransmitter-gated ion-channel ligand binding domain
MKRILVPVLVTMSIQVARGGEAPAVIERPGADDGPTRVSIGIWMVDITSIDSAQQSFTAEMALVLRWKDSRLTHTGNGVVRYPLEQVWHPRIAIVNETNSVTRKFPDSVEVEPDGTVNYRQRYAGAFSQPLRLQSFPFDRQGFHVQLVAVRYRPNEVQFVPDQEWIVSFDLRYCVDWYICTSAQLIRIDRTASCGTRRGPLLGSILRSSRSLFR